MTEQLTFSFDALKQPSNKDCLPCIGVFGRKNCGKSSFINALAKAEIAEVAKTAGTTKEPSKYYTELENIGGVFLIDTSGIDDYGDSGEKRVQNSMEILNNIDFAVLIITGDLFAEPEKKLVSKFQDFSIPFVVVNNKSDLQEVSSITRSQVELAYQTKLVEFSCLIRSNLAELVFILQNLIPPSAYESKSILKNLIKKNDLIVLTSPERINAPDGQLTIAQIEITRDLLENDCLTLFIKQDKLPETLEQLQPKPKLVILSTSTFSISEKVLPADMQLTTYGIVMARHKGDFERYILDTPKISNLDDGNHVLILQTSIDNTSNEYKEQDLLKDLLIKFTEKKLEFHVLNVFEKPFINLRQFQFAVICGSFLLTKKQVTSILKPLTELNIPVSSYDMVNAYSHGIFDRAIAPFQAI